MKRKAIRFSHVAAECTLPALAILVLVHDDASNKAGHTNALVLHKPMLGGWAFCCSDSLWLPELLALGGSTLVPEQKGGLQFHRTCRDQYEPPHLCGLTILSRAQKLLKGFQDQWTITRVPDRERRWGCALKGYGRIFQRRWTCEVGVIRYGGRRDDDPKRIDSSQRKAVMEEDDSCRARIVLWEVCCL